MSPWFFNLCLDGVTREMKAKVGDVGVEMCVNDGKWMLNTILFADNTFLLAKYENDLQKVVNVFDTVCKRRKLKVNINKSKVMVFERSKIEVVDFACPYRVRLQCPKECKIRLNGEKWRRFMSLSTLVRLCASMAGETREGTVQGRKVDGSLRRMMKERTVSIAVKKRLRDGIIVPTINESETWVWNERQRSRIQAAEMSYLRSACGIRRMDGESNESLYNKFGMSRKGEE